MNALRRTGLIITLLILNGAFNVALGVHIEPTWVNVAHTTLLIVTGAAIGINMAFMAAKRLARREFKRYVDDYLDRKLAEAKNQQSAFCQQIEKLKQGVVTTDSQPARFYRLPSEDCLRN